MPKGEVASTGASNISDLIATLRDRAPKVAMAAAAVQWAYPTVQRLRTQRQDNTAYTIKVEDSDDIYDNLHEWVLARLPEHDQRALTAWTRRGNGTDFLTPVGPGSYEPVTPRVRLRYDGSRSHTIRIGEHKIRVLVSEGKENRDKRWSPNELIFTCPTLAARNALLDEIAKVADEVYRNTARKPSFRMLNMWGEWDRLDDLAYRDLDSVILPEGQLDRLIADVQDWLDAEATYARRCQPWHRGHLYEGPPGTGKTSVARAIASHFNMDVWYLPLADLKKDGDLLSVINRVTPRSMLLLEDIDVFHAASERNDDNKGATLSGLLNALDGVATPHGLFTVMTTNDMAKIDPAVIRPGRADLVEHFGLAKSRQIAGLLARWYDDGFLLTQVPFEVSDIAPAKVIEVCKRHDDPQHAIKELWEETAS